jgi:hypothetical protein
MNLLYHFLNSFQNKLICCICKGALCYLFLVPCSLPSAAHIRHTEMRHNKQPNKSEHRICCSGICPAIGAGRPDAMWHGREQGLVILTFPTFCIKRFQSVSREIQNTSLTKDQTETLNRTIRAHTLKECRAYLQTCANQEHSNVHLLNTCDWLIQPVEITIGSLPCEKLE